MRNKKGSIWVSAVLYFGLGLVVLTIILTAATPVINRLRDKNIVIQTKEVFQVLDSNIREVAREGPGAQRPLTIDIRKGQFSVLQDGPGADVNPRVSWNYDTKALLAEPCWILPTERKPIEDCATIQEGNLEILVTPGIEKGSWNTTLFVDYGSNIYIQYESPVNILTGSSALVIRNAGVSCGPNQNFDQDADNCPQHARPTVEIVKR